jgi:putative toxin-antitoxin system antitoxin component (TIGR02293 family)
MWHTSYCQLAEIVRIIGAVTLPRRRSASLARAERRAVGPHRVRGSSLGLSALATDELIRSVQRGFPFKALEFFSAQTGFAPANIASLIQLPERTLARRKTSGRLSPDESERLLRISTIFEKAVDLFEGNVGEAVEWLTKPKKALGENVPLSYSRSELGAREVENLIGRLEHGVFT